MSHGLKQVEAAGPGDRCIGGRIRLGARCRDPPRFGGQGEAWRRLRRLHAAGVSAADGLLSSDERGNVLHGVAAIAEAGPTSTFPAAADQQTEGQDQPAADSQIE